MSMDDVQGIIRTSPFLVDYHKNLTEKSHENRFEKVPARKHLERRHCQTWEMEDKLFRLVLKGLLLFSRFFV